ncbi:hypothetical protein [Rhodopirellula sp. MGV]|uniref:hypothetical protein n=1 Tax=Rhodopirellula sp. MGV TaxID=2023130 RepID=UPI000B97C0E9|nr:hypothetical protein [Rhodopirellula sp. MGV]OYP38397.1 hypothetical protein CGZ80_02305 [Rhodopirellula sp. MGV]PNY34183.1 hypothetical protein C2E31_24525 [Rhodopirellula baltica]
MTSSRSDELSREPPTPTPRFAILRHHVGRAFRREPRCEDATAVQPVHWDWLFQTPMGERLSTWSTEELGSPFPWDETQRYEAIRIADHRLKYLDYEGDIGGDRGTVRRIAEGAIVRFDLGSDLVHFRVKMHSDAFDLYGGLLDLRFERSRLETGADQSSDTLSRWTLGIEKSIEFSE